MSPTPRPAALAVLVALLASAAPAAARTKLAVLDFRAIGASEQAARAVTDALIGALGEDPALDVVSSSDIRNLLAFEAQKQLAGCEDSSCLVELGGALGAALIVSGSVASLGGTWQVNAQLIDVARANVRARASGTQTSEARLFDTVNELARSLRSALDAASVPERFAVRLGASGLTGVLGVGVEWRPTRHLGIALGSGRYALSGGLDFSLWGAGGPYLDLHAAWSQAGLLGPVSRPGVGAGVTIGWDLRPLPWLSIKAGGGLVWNSAMADAEKPRLLMFDLAVGPVFR